ncbi:ACP phosphodiesterase [Rheinheimera sp.]|uniref:acyl carrier protein phosphodiesterase n=1 Tax=Rheinheimera sp. TaxID=1869214 RepID=UPI00307F8154
MNYLAHLWLAQHNTNSRVGNLLGDFCRGVDLTQQHPAVLAGLYNHRAVDWFTDQAIDVQQARQLFSPSMRRFAPVALDLFFDHLLIRHWAEWNQQPFLPYKTQLYLQLQLELPQMPTGMAAVMQNVVQQDWFGSYASVQGIQQAVRALALRGQRTGLYAAIADELPQLQPHIEPLFLRFIPQLQQFVEQAAIEQSPAQAKARYISATGKDQSRQA